MVAVEKMGAVIVTLDGKILMIVQLLQHFPPQTPVQVAVSIEKMGGMEGSVLPALLTTEPYVLQDFIVFQRKLVMSPPILSLARRSANATAPPQVHARW